MGPQPTPQELRDTYAYYGFAAPSEELRTLMDTINRGLRGLRRLLWPTPAPAWWL